MAAPLAGRPCQALATAATGAGAAAATTEAVAAGTTTAASEATAAAEWPCPCASPIAATHCPAAWTTPARGYSGGFSSAEAPYPTQPSNRRPNPSQPPSPAPAPAQPTSPDPTSTHPQFTPPNPAQPLPYRRQMAPAILQGGQVLSWSDKFKYLGSHCAATCELDTELSYRISCATMVFRRLQRPFFCQRGVP